MPGPEDLTAVADELSGLAAAVAGALDPVVAHHRPDVWQGGRAVRFGRELVDQRAQLRAAAGDLEAEARLLRARAGLLQPFGP